MTDPHPAPIVRQEEDRLPGKGLSWVLGGTLLIIVLLSLWAYQIWRSRVTMLPQARVTPAQVGIIDQTLIDFDTSSRALENRKRALLQSYGWISEATGIARIPIDEAMELIVEKYR
jgi:hypothetical protein